MRHYGPTVSEDAERLHHVLTWAPRYSADVVEQFGEDALRELVAAGRARVEGDVIVPLHRRTFSCRPGSDAGQGAP